MKLFVNFNNRAMNKRYGDMAHEIKRIITRRSQMAFGIDQNAMDAMKKDGFASIYTPGPGWYPQVSVSLDKMEAAGLVKEWGYR